MNSIRPLICMIAALTVAASTSQAVTVLSEDFETYVDGDPLAVAPGWTGDVTNQTAYVTNSGTSLVGEFTGTDWGVIGMYLQGYTPPLEESKLLSDYTIEFDVEKTEGTSTSPEVEIHTDTGLVRMNYPDPAVGGGVRHISLNPANNIYIDGGFTLTGTTSIDVVLKQFGGAAGVRQTYRIDNIVLSVDPSPFVKHDCLPTGTLIGDSATLSATYEDNAFEIDTMTLYLDGSSVVSSNSYAGGSETNTISYAATGLALGVHTAKVVVSSGGTSLTNQWTFKLIADDPTIEVGSEDFEAYSVGAWDAATYPDPNPTLAGGAQSATIIDSGSTNGLELLIDGNLSNQWSTGIQFFMNMNGYNQSTDPADYTVTFQARFDDITQDLANMGFEMILWNPAVGAQGNFYQMGAVAPIEFGLLQSGEMWANFTIPLGVADERPYSKTETFDPSATQWHYQFAANNNLAANDKPVTFTIDEVFVSYTKPPFINPTVGPVGVTTNDPVLTATVIDGTSEVDTMELYMDGALVASDTFTGGSTTNTITYQAVGAAGGSHNAMVIYAESGTTNIGTNVWSFIVPAPPIAPATEALALWNVNMAGCVNNGLRTVSNGLVLVAPTTGGSNIWNNAYGPDAPWSSPNTTLLGANENNFNVVGIEFEASNWNDGPQSWAGYFTEFTALSNTIWGATQGDNDDGIVRFTGVDTNETYDVYVYWTWNRNDDAKTFNVIEGTCNLPTLTMDPDRATLIANPTNYLEGTNYVVFTGITPDASGNIAIQPNYSCAYQLVQRGNGGGPGGPTVDPDIMYVSVSEGMASLMWNSETGVTYSVMSKSSLTDPSWTALTNVPGAGATTWASVPASADQGFFSVEGN